MSWTTEAGLSIPAGSVLAGMCVRLIGAAVLGAVLGLERESKARAAGMRTHMLVATGSALFAIVTVHLGGIEQIGHIVKGVAAGVGFLGMGTILKREESGSVEGLTTAAGVWATAAIGLCAGAGPLILAGLGAAIAFLVLKPCFKLRRKMDPDDESSEVERE